MSTPIDPEAGDVEVRSVMDERRNLLNVGYRLLGSLIEAEDVVQEAYTRWYGMSPSERAAIENPGAWLTTVTSRICLSQLTSARVRRETYVGNWIPEPLPGPDMATHGASDDVAADPVDRVTLDESVGMALMVVMESMTPAERVAFILHDVFGYRFAEIAEIVGRSPGACRQLASSARSRVRAAGADAASAVRRPDVIRRFEAAWRAKDIDTLVELLDPSVVATADSGGRAVAFREPLEGRDAVLEVWLQLADRIGELTLHQRSVNGQPGLIAKDAEGTTVSIYAFDVVDDVIRRIWAIRNPDKLGPWLA
ncbi:RNA polymerase sigma24 factor [Flexivirga endophytica]|uniref:RNA polymerase sigma24 factor n=1 Tax=Flexivirga endophytica TaxID=1849103 RepID=A0A916SSD7_9MICO|nr:RNA polymerase sigma factor SigJ [Flexivirga endophytica]GGB14411.1 RNA polymerase sigma24 factor [Flexivirga endophytica]GHB65878.1 RNA polymerase sigma24 factor [Flexivirga endophytica]